MRLNLGKAELVNVKSKKKRFFFVFLEMMKLMTRRFLKPKIFNNGEKINEHNFSIKKHLKKNPLTIAMELLDAPNFDGDPIGVFLTFEDMILMWIGNS